MGSEEGQERLLVSLRVLYTLSNSLPSRLDSQKGNCIVSSIFYDFLKVTFYT